jgi:hypothetical protein
MSGKNVKKMIKLIDILKEITEGKQIGTLYHFTYLESISKIFKNGLRFNPDNSELPIYKDMFYISTTRDYTGKKFAKDSEYVVRITLDGNKISEHYSIEPINVNYIWAKNTGINVGKMPAKDVYYEERIFSSKGGYLDPKYIIKMDTIIPESELRGQIAWGKEDSKRTVYFDDSIFKYVNDGKLNFIKNFNSK